MPTLNYLPPPTGQHLLADNSMIRAIMGPVGSGKTTVCIMDLVQRACTQEPNADKVRKTRFAIVRNTVRMLRDTTIKSVHDWLPPGIAGEWRSTTNSYTLRFPLADGTRVESEWWFRPLDAPDDVRNLLSLEITGAWLNEYREIPSSVLTDILGRCGRYPPKREAVPTFPGIVMDTNPPAQGSDWYGLFETTASPGVQAALDRYAARFNRPVKALFRQPSGLSPQAENVEHLPEGYYDLLLAAGNSDDWVRVHVHGEYGRRRDGLPVYPEFSRDLHVSASPLSPSPHLPLYVFCDWGLTPAAVLVQEAPSGQWQVLAELVTENTSIEQFATRLRKVCCSRAPDIHDIRAYGDPSGNQRSQVNLVTAFEAMRAGGFNVRPGPSDWDTRVGSVRRCLTRLLPEGQPGLLIDPSARVLIDGFAGAYHYGENARTKEADERPVKNMSSHVHDALQHGLGVFEGPKIAGRRAPGDRQTPHQHKKRPWDVWQS